MPRSVPSPSLSPFVSSSRRTLEQRLRARLGRRRGSETQRAYMGEREPGTPPPATVTRADYNSYFPPGRASAGGSWPAGALNTGLRSHPSESSSSVPGSSGSATAAPGANGAPPEPAASLEDQVTHLLAMGGSLHAPGRCPTCDAARRTADYPDEWGFVVWDDAA